MSKKIAIPGITIFPMGGIGNQLFIYCAGRQLSLLNDCPLYIDNRWFKTQVKREFALDKLTINSKNLDVQYINEGSCGNWLSKWSKWQFFVRVSRRLVTKHVTERDFSFDSRIVELNPGRSIHGYFQSWKYFEKSASQIREEISAGLPAEVSWVEKYKLEFDQSKPWVAIHVRRGDYLEDQNPEYHGILGLNYYLAALDVIKEIKGECTLVVFSDSPDLASEIFANVHQSVIMITPPEEATDWESLSFMSEADGIVIANSSFSWWAAWLGERDGRPVVAPSPWFGPAGPQELDLLPLPWIKVENV